MSLFKEVRTGDPEKALDILFGNAMGVIPELSATQFRSAYDRMHRSWGDIPLVEGSENEVKSVILRTAKVLVKKPISKSSQSMYASPIRATKAKKQLSYGPGWGKLGWLSICGKRRTHFTRMEDLNSCLFLVMDDCTS